MNCAHVLVSVDDVWEWGTEPQGKTQFVYDESGHLISEWNNGLVRQEHVYLGDRPIAIINPAGNLFRVHTDALDTPRAVSNRAGEVVWRWNPDEAFGNNPPTADSKIKYYLRFAGQYEDQETGLYYNYFRDYNPATGRYIESDPIGLSGGLNTYGYVEGNPLRWVDPMGLWWRSLPTAARDVLRQLPEGARNAWGQKSQKPKPKSDRHKGKSGDKYPSWADGEFPRNSETGQEYAKRLCDEKYGADNYPKGPDTPFNELRKRGDRNFERTPLPEIKDYGQDIYNYPGSPLFDPETFDPEYDPSRT